VNDISAGQKADHFMKWVIARGDESEVLRFMLYAIVRKSEQTSLRSVVMDDGEEKIGNARREVELVQ
jgi:hypothetical protein